MVSESMLFLASSFFSLLYHSPRIILGMLQLKSEKFSVDHELNSWASLTPNSPEEQVKCNSKLSRTTEFTHLAEVGRFGRFASLSTLWFIRASLCKSFPLQNSVTPHHSSNRQYELVAAAALPGAAQQAGPANLLLPGSTLATLIGKLII